MKTRWWCRRPRCCFSRLRRYRLLKPGELTHPPETRSTTLFLHQCVSIEHRRHGLLQGNIPLLIELRGQHRAATMFLCEGAPIITSVSPLVYIDPPINTLGERLSSLPQNQIWPLLALTVIATEVRLVSGTSCLGWHLSFVVGYYYRIACKT